MAQPNLFGEFPAPENNYHLKGEGYISASNLAKADPELQKEVMEVWFYEHFEDPVHSCPYISEEGGYVDQSQNSSGNSNTHHGEKKRR